MPSQKPKYITQNVKVGSNYRDGVDIDKVSEDIMDACNKMDEQGYDVLSIQKIDDMRSSPIKITDIGTQTVGVIITGVRRNNSQILEE